MRKKVLLIVGSIVASLVIGMGGLFLFVVSGIGGPLPTIWELRHAHRPIASKVLASDQSVLGSIYMENRSVVDIGNCHPFLIDALIATEDVRFFRHRGVDYRSLARVLIKGLVTSAGGGSTLSQQLAKNLFPRKNYRFFNTPIHKLREIIVARRLERILSKEEILELYLNTVSFGELTFGIHTAARRFFNTTPYELRPEQSATLVGMLKAPTYYSPRIAPERALQRRNVVFAQMAKYAYLSQEECDSLQALPLEIDYTPEAKPSELSRYILTQVEKQVHHILSEKFADSSRLVPDAKTDGLTIYTTIDPLIQKYAEAAVRSQMPKIQAQFDREWGSAPDWETHGWLEQEIQKLSVAYDDPSGLHADEKVQRTVFSWDKDARIREMSVLDSLRYYKRILQAGLFAMDPATGFVKAWVGGIDHQYFPYDHVLSRRQAGSTFKVFVYAAALEAGIDPCAYFDNTRIVFSEHDDWSPQNSDRVYGGSYSMEGGLVHSVNTIAVRLLQKVGVRTVVDMAHRLGIQSHIPEVPSIALGTAEVRLDELTTAYAPFANGGFAVNPVCILKIEDKNGNVLYEYAPPPADTRTQVISDTIAQKMLRMMQMVVDSGTARALGWEFGLYGPYAGKTGTTQDYTDGWYVGISPGLVAGAWVGADDHRVHFKSSSSGGGSGTALKVYGAFIQGMVRDKAFKAQLKNRTDVVLEEHSGPLCPYFSHLQAHEMEGLLAQLRENQERMTLAEFLQSLFEPEQLDQEEAERRILEQMQRKLDRTAIRMQKQGKSPVEISRRLQEIRSEYNERIREIRKAHAEKQNTRG